MRENKQWFTKKIDKMAYPVDDTQGQGFAVESIQDSNSRSGIQIFGQCTDQKWTLIL